MRKDPLFKPPEITDDDIVRVSRLLNLDERAFFREDGTDPRAEVIKSMERMDIAACPGSGKTTLLVAKLAILAEKWQYPTRGICVLSHTNVARQQIESRLGNTSAGRRLLSYPHFVGTIHGFVNEFLTLPLLRSLGNSGTLFSTEISGYKIWRLSKFGRELPRYLYQRIKDSGKRKEAVRNAHYSGENLDIVLETGNIQLPLKRDRATDAFSTIDEWKSAVLRDGYAAYEDTFAYGNHALRQHPFLVNTLRDRFPLWFVDEVQDNSQEQSAILHRIFMEGNEAVICQRLGDENQAIFETVDTEEATTDKFPIEGIKRELPNSHRFGQQIANLADPLGIVRHENGLKGHGPKEKLLAPSVEEAYQTIFLFDESSVTKVLESYAELILETFSEHGLRQGKFVAAGFVHKPPDMEKDHKFPHHVGRYWRDYDPELTKVDPKPTNFTQYVFAGLGKASLLWETFQAVEKIGEGILRLAGMTEESPKFQHRRHIHRHIMSLLEQHPEVRERYIDLIEKFAVERVMLTKEMWDNRWCGVVREIAETIGKSTFVSSEAKDFLGWNEAPHVTESPTTTPKSRDNIFRLPKDGKEVAIQVGSIHSVKGKTVTAMLVLETFWNHHNLAELTPWLQNHRGKVGRTKMGNSSDLVSSFTTSR